MALESNNGNPAANKMIHLSFNSPEEEVFFAPITDKGVKLFFKRDDLIHPFISGNKWRKLKYNLIKAQQNQKTHLITFGGAYSNHLLATAAAGAKFKFKTTAFVRGESVINETLSICKIFGMNLLFTEREAYKNKQMLFDNTFRNDDEAFFIDEGGAGADAELGCREIITELKNTYDHIFCAAGKGTTSAGIINQLILSNLKAIFHMVPVLKSGEFIAKDIAPLIPLKTSYQLHCDYHFGGYAKTQPNLIQFIKDFSASTGILTDPVYTGKALFCIKDLAEKNYFSSGAKVLMIHTGGLFGLLGMKEKF